MKRQKTLKKFSPGRGSSKGDWDAVSHNPEWTKDDFVKAKPFEEMFPCNHEAWAAGEGFVIYRPTRACLWITLHICSGEEPISGNPGFNWFAAMQTRVQARADAIEPQVVAIHGIAARQDRLCPRVKRRIVFP